MKPWFKLNFPVANLISESFLFPKHKDDLVNPLLNLQQDKRGKVFDDPRNNVWIFHFKDTPVTSILSLEAIEFFKSLRLHPQTIWVFRANTAHPGNIHCDWAKHHTVDQRDENNCAINWTLGESQNHAMVWYEPINSTVVDGWPVDAFTPNPAQPHVSPVWYKEHVRVIDKCTITGPTLVRINIPHNGENYDPGNPRWCFSLRVRDVGKNWESSVDRFKDFIVE